MTPEVVTQKDKMGATLKTSAWTCFHGEHERGVLGDNLPPDLSGNPFPIRAERLSLRFRGSCKEEGRIQATDGDRGLISQVHSIKKTLTKAGYARFDTEKNERHADKFWALALAVHAAGIAAAPRRFFDLLPIVVLLVEAGEISLSPRPDSIDSLFLETWTGKRTRLPGAPSLRLGKGSQTRIAIRSGSLLRPALIPYC